MTRGFVCPTCQTPLIMGLYQRPHINIRDIIINVPCLKCAHCGFKQHFAMPRPVSMEHVIVLDTNKVNIRIIRILEENFTTVRLIDNDLGNYPGTSYSFHCEQSYAP